MQITLDLAKLSRPTLQRAQCVRDESNVGKLFYNWTHKGLATIRGLVHCIVIKQRSYMMNKTIKLPTPIQAIDLISNTVTRVVGYEIVPHVDSDAGEYVLWLISNNKTIHGDYRTSDEIKFI